LRADKLAVGVRRLGRWDTSATSEQSLPTLKSGAFLALDGCAAIEGVCKRLERRQHVGLAVAQRSAPPARSGRERILRLFKNEKFIAWLWIGPAVLFVGIFLFYPVLQTIWVSFFNFNSSKYVGLKNYQFIFTNPDLLNVLRNNLLWLVLATAGTVFLGLIIAVLVDRVRVESFAKSAIFIPMALSLVATSVIWRFVYAYDPHVGLLNAIVTALGGQPQGWITDPHFDNYMLIVAYVWMWTGFCMVILSAALKSIPTEILEAARVDGATEIGIFFRITVPMITPTIAVVTTTMLINVLKIFDIVYVMTGGFNGTNVIALDYYNQYFEFNNFGIASALAVVLLVAIVPIMVFNIRRFRVQEAQR
jgi:alpha-glucoside transport system permease protein